MGRSIAEPVPAASHWITKNSQSVEKEITTQDWKKVEYRPQEQDGNLALRAKCHQLSVDFGVECCIGDNKHMIPKVELSKDCKAMDEDRHQLI